MNTIELAKKVRLDILNMTHHGHSSHIASAFSITDIVAVLYGDVMTFYPDDVIHPDRDRFILSKGHAGAAVYATLAELGVLEKEVLKTHYANGSLLSGHISHKGIKGVEFSTGSLGHGLPVATGMAYAAMLDGKKHNVYALLSDGECDEGSNWEAIMFAAHHHLYNLRIIIDYNKLQSLDTVKNTLNLEPFADKFKAFNCNVKLVDGHDHQALKNCFDSLSDETKKPTVIIANTVKGKGVSFMENQVLWHYRSPQGEEYEAALSELGG